MARQASTGGGSGLLPSGAVGFSNVINVDDDIPEGYKPAVVYKNAKGKYIDPFGREVTHLGTLQEAGVSGSPEQKATTQYNEPLPEDANADEIADGGEGDTDNDDE